ncbi:hypothetical protein H072_6463 [Dactylellina haptotyla CBS 200.50]|uniref:Uncharacterized protein n=1 Tax=Dactylellina haptotyla (strain CBS 200.50) TaxID=1284197 RepID=S8BWP8_DACHA|nr:hypothetical protein H072_6463 [Dactylellina haptotyla CBS 200.50]
MLAQYYKVVQLLQILPKSELGFDFGLKKSALDIAIMMGRTDIVVALLQAGASQDRRSNKTLAYDKGHLALMDMMEYVANKKELDEDPIERAKDGETIDPPQIGNGDQDVLVP